MKKPVYTHPVILDIGQNPAFGQTTEPPQPLGVCIPGHTITGLQCAVGVQVSNPSVCDPNGYQEFTMQCSAGTDGSSGCLSGAVP